MSAGKGACGGGGGVGNDVIWSPRRKGACGGGNAVAFGV